MKVLENKFYKLEVFQSEKYMLLTWLPETKDMSNEDYKQSMFQVIDIAKEYNMTKHIADTLQFYFIISIDLQEWGEKNIKPIYDEINYKKIAFIMSPEIFSQVSIEQTMDEAETDDFVSKFFDNMEDAKKWLL